MIVVDTNVWSETLRAEPDARVLQWLSTYAAELYMPALVAHELAFGVELLPDGARRRRLDQSIQAMLGRLAERILPYDADTARTHAALRARSRRAGHEPSAEDGQIAAHAAQLQAALATRNTNDFAGLGIELTNPWGP